MLIALLALLGVNLIVVAALAAAVVGRRRWLARQPGSFSGAVRVSEGELDGLGTSWRRGSGRWVRDVLVWEKGPFLFRTVLVPVDGSIADRVALPGEVKRLGEQPAVAEMQVGTARLEVAARSEQHSLLVAGLSR